MYTLSAQIEQRNFEDTRRRLEQARELLLAFAIINGRLPCPARSAATPRPCTVAGDEVVTTATGCIGDAVTDYYGGVSGGVTLGLLPARTIGYQQVDPGRLRGRRLGQPHPLRGREPGHTNCSGSFDRRRTSTNTVNLKANGISCQPSDLLICKSATGITATTCGGAREPDHEPEPGGRDHLFDRQERRAAPCAGGIDEAANLNGDRDLRLPHADAEHGAPTASSTTSSSGSPSASSTAG